MKILLIAAAALPLAGAHDSATERLKDHPWALWTDGSWVKYEIQNPATGKMVTTETLVSVGPNAYRLKGEWEGGEGERVSDHGFATMGYPHLQPGAQRIGEEMRTVDGASFDCGVWKARWNENGKTYEAVAWVAEGWRHPVRLEQKSDGLTLQLEVAKREDWVTVARRKFRCVRYEGVTIYEGRRSPVTQWRTFDIPGGMAKTVSKVTTPQGVVQHVNAVVEFRGTPRR